MAMHNIMVRATALGNARGRIDYISSPQRQEHLQAVYNSTNDDFWKALADHCRKQAKYSQTKKACEAREWMVPLANELADIYSPEELARLASKQIKEKTGTENVVAVHWNKKKNNYHLHIISAENEEINKVKEGAILRQNTYFDKNGKRSTKKNCVDQNGNLMPGCTFYKKGERKVERIRFSPKIEEIGSKTFLQDLKRDLANWQNELLQEDRFRVFDPSLYIAEQHIGRNATVEQQEAIIAKNKLVQGYNAAVDECLRLSSIAQQLQREMEFIRKLRKDIKKYALKENWENAIMYYFKFLTGRAEKWIDMIRRQQEQGSRGPRRGAVEPSERKESLLDKIAAAEAERDQQGANRSRIRRDYRDREGR